MNFRGLNCTLVRDPRGDLKGHCWWCGEPLPKYARKWCSTRRYYVMLYDDDSRDRFVTDGRCERAWWRNHSWPEARLEALRRSSGLPESFLAYEWARCDQCGSQECLEVNHVEPRVGRGYQAGCHNHQTNLQVLCHDCHVEETTRQLYERKLAAADAGTDYLGRRARKRLGLPQIPSTPTPGIRR